MRYRSPRIQNEKEDIDFFLLAFFLCKMNSATAAAAAAAAVTRFKHCQLQIVQIISFAT